MDIWIIKSKKPFFGRPNHAFQRIASEGHSVLNILIYTQCFAPKLGGIESVMTNIATQSSKIGHDVSVLADGSKSKCLSFDSQQNFEIKRFDQIKFFRNKIKSSFANDLLKNKTFDLVGWQNTDIYQNFNITFISSIRKNRVIEKNLFTLPSQN